MALIQPDQEFNNYHFSIDEFINIDVKNRIEHQNNVMHSICKFYQKGSCVKGKSCIFKHIKLERNTMCKHWFRGLCKKNEYCEFLHELDLSRMPICDFYLEQGECTKDGCLFLHVDPADRIKNCPYYDQGFCRHGPNCRNRHVRREACSNYLVGFCPLGNNCTFGHPKFETPNDDKSIQSNICNKCGSTGHKPGNCPVFPEVNKAPSRPLMDVTCFKCNQRGHYANTCTNRKIMQGPNMPGGGAEGFMAQNYPNAQAYQNYANAQPNYSNTQPNYSNAPSYANAPNYPSRN